MDKRHGSLDDLANVFGLFRSGPDGLRPLRVGSTDCALSVSDQNSFSVGCHLHHRGIPSRRDKTPNLAFTNFGNIHPGQVIVVCVGHKKCFPSGERASALGVLPPGAFGKSVVTTVSLTFSLFKSITETELLLASATKSLLPSYERARSLGLAPHFNRLSHRPGSPVHQSHLPLVPETDINGSAVAGNKTSVGDRIQ